MPHHCMSLGEMAVAARDYHYSPAPSDGPGLSELQPSVSILYDPG